MPKDFIHPADPSGMAIQFADRRGWSQAKSGKGPETALLALIRMRMLAESGHAEFRETECGIYLPSPNAVRLDDETRLAFGLPPAWPGGLRLVTQHYPQHPQFDTSMTLVGGDGTQFSHWKMRGPLLEAAGECFLPTYGQFAALLAWTEWRQDSEHNERSNLTLLAGLREAQRQGCSIDLGTYQEWPVEMVNDLAVTVESDAASGGLTLGVELDTAAGRVTAGQMAKREHHLAGDEAAGIVRAGDEGRLTVLLTEQQAEQARRILKNRHVSSDEKEAFLRNPSRWLVEQVLSGVPGEFSPRVLGLEYWKDLGLGPQSPSEIDWTVQRPEPEKPDGDGKKGGDGAGAENRDDLEPSTDPVVAEIADNIRTAYGRKVPALDERMAAPLEPDFSRYARPPKPHQVEAVRCLLAYAERAWAYEQAGGGAVFADDMGLGKTFATLVLLGEWMRHRRRVDGKEPPAVLIVAPLTLIENWRDEIGKAYPEPAAVFTRIIDLHPDKDLPRFRDPHLVKDETEEDAQGKPTLVKPALIYGRGDTSSLDMPGSLVLMTYDTMRRFNLSLAQCQWSVVIFDEAQALKNPNAIQTITAKSLRARFRLMMTGTPIENGLRDFWCLFDTAEPGLLETWGEFQKAYVKPLVDKTEAVPDVLDRLRTKVGCLMLRRMKEDKLEGLPKKNIILRHPERADEFDTRVTATMSGEQLQSYNEARGAGIESASAARNESEKNRHFLAALWHLREATLHPALVGGGLLPVGRDAREVVAILQRSAKLAKLLEILAEIRARREKVLIFAIGKKLQAGLAANLSRLYGLEIPVINGDTPASSKGIAERTRMGMLREFMPKEPPLKNESTWPVSPPGFGIAILSPIAAGVGLTLTEANHVIHLERHWNPAKEAQATDRVYRIGQERDVHVWVPILKHPEMVSFDENLDRLLERKAALHHALSIPEAVTDAEVFGSVFDSESKTATHSMPLTLDDVRELSGYLFEALAAEVFAVSGASRVILTPEGSDHGCDVAVMDANGNKGENWLIQCKHTIQPKLKGDMPVREIVGSRWHYETHLGEKFTRLAVLTTAKRFDRQCRNAAAGQAVQLLDAGWLKERLRAYTITRGAVLRRQTTRQRV